ncbi:MAG: hypothetical protein OEW48_14355 [Phycisphaerae bacterium]|nr:hypothetical protein [Phycisphaerae bacterium]
MRKYTNNKFMKAICITLMLAISGPSAFALPPDPDNAALLYYQAFLLYEQPDESTRDLLKDVSEGKIEPSKKIIEYVEGCHTSLELAMVGSEIPMCHWGVRFSEGFAANLPFLAQARFLYRLVVADARILAGQGAYREALSRCLVAKRMGQHMGDNVLISVFVAISIDKGANNCIRDILGRMPADVETLQWLKTQVATVPTRALSINHALKLEQEVALQTMRVENIDMLVETLTGAGIEVSDEMLKAVDKMSLEKCREHYSNHMSAMQNVLSAPMTYAKKYRELEKLDKRAKSEAKGNTDAAITAFLAPASAKAYNLSSNAHAINNATRTAVDIYIIKAKTGKLPDGLPADSPKDPFSGKDFEYEVTKNSFVLHCQAEDLEKNEIHQYEFKVSK